MIKQSLFLIALALLINIGGTNLSDAATSGNIDTYTNINALELKPISSIDNSFKTAAVCFLGIGDCQQGDYARGDDDMDVDSAKQCQNEGYIYTAKNCLLPSFLSKPCGYNEAYFAECNKDIPRACREAGYKQVSSCASGQKLKSTPRCQWDNSYGICCKESCPTNSSLTCSGASAGDDTCGYTCKKCCSDACPSGQQLYYSGSNGSRTECGNQCKRCNTACPSGSSTGYSGSSAGNNECGNTCRYCSSSCPGGSYDYRTGSGSCGGSTTRDECGSKTCYYPYETCPCYPSCSSEGGCSCGSYSVSNGCGGYCTRCNACCSETCYGQSSPCSSSQIQTSSCSLKCGSGTRYTCQAKPACTETCSGQSSPCSSSQIQTSSCSLKCSSGTRYSCQAKPACTETCSGQSSPCSSSQIQTSSCSLKCGSGTRYSCQAKPTCTPKNCSGYSLGSCPTNGSCSSCTIGCGDNSTKYTLNGCNSGYTQSGSRCIVDHGCPGSTVYNSVQGCCIQSSCRPSGGKVCACY